MELGSVPFSKEDCDPDYVFLVIFFTSTAQLLLMILLDALSHYLPGHYVVSEWPEEPETTPGSVRVTRLTAFTLTLAISVIPLYFRLAGVAECQLYWTIFVVFSLIPFVSGALAWTRTLVDGVLYRYGRSVMDSTKGWWNKFPIFCLPYKVLQLGITRCVGEHDGDAVRRGLEGDMELGPMEWGSGDELDDEPPAYSAGWGPSSEGKIGAPVHERSQHLLLTLQSLLR
jgi:hypothetical protein